MKITRYTNEKMVSDVVYRWKNTYLDNETGLWKSDTHYQVYKKLYCLGENPGVEVINAAIGHDRFTTFLCDICSQSVSAINIIEHAGLPSEKMAQCDECLKLLLYGKV